jgi:hypothetical protein
VRRDPARFADGGRVVGACVERWVQASIARITTAGCACRNRGLDVTLHQRSFIEPFEMPMPALDQRSLIELVEIR